MKFNDLKATGILPAVVIGVCVGVSLAGYVPPTVEKNPVTAEASDAQGEGETKSDASPGDETDDSEDEEEDADDFDASAVEAMAFDVADGTYMGTGTGYSGEIKVAVTVTDHKITDVKILSESDTDAFFNKAKAVIDRVIETQSYDVDTISGATYSSKGILAAIKNALTGQKDTSTAQAQAAGTSSVGGTTGTSQGSGSGNGSAAISYAKTPATLKDGTYTGEGRGFGGTTKVQVTISGGKITSCQVLSNQDTPEYFHKTSVLCDRIVSAGGVTGVDTISGATYSSRGILEGASNAIAKAGGGSTSGITSTPTPTPTGKPALSPTPTPAPKPDGDKKAGEAAYQDGTYTGKGTGFGGTMHAQVTISDGKITDVKIVDNKDTEAFFTKALVLCDQIVKNNGVDGLDAVSGATYRSNGIFEAVKNALAEAAGTADEDKDKDKDEETKEKGHYIDGTYIGTGNGYGGKTTVQVTVVNGNVSSVKVTDNNDTAAFFGRAESLCDSIVSKNGVSGIDVVSGATYSSRGILEGAADALKKAGGTDSVSISLPDPEEEDKDKDKDEDDDSSEPLETGKFPYPDGTYLGTGEGNGGPITVSLVISDKTITAAAVLSAEDEDKPYISKAKTILKTLVQKQTTRLDAVSGATNSSNGIIEAVNHALEAAEKAASDNDNPKDDVDKKEDDTKKDDDKKDTEDDSPYADGTYAAAALVDPGEDGDFDAYTLSLTVRVKDGKITSVDNAEGSGEGYIAKDARYITRALSGTSSAKGIQDQLLEKQSAENLDAVSGATWSSKAMITAIKEALQAASEAKKSSVSENTVTSEEIAGTSESIVAMFARLFNRN